MANQTIRVVGYISPVTYGKFREFMQEQALTEAEAMDRILSAYLGTTPLSKLPNGFDTFDKFNKKESSSLTAESPPSESPAIISNDKSLTQYQLAERLKCETTKLTDIRGYPVVLADYTRTRDPEGIAWEYESEFNLYFPLDS